MAAASWPARSWERSAAPGLGQGIRLVRGERLPSASWSEPFLRDLCRRTVLRYLAIAHFGRGRGGYEDVELPDAWRVLVDEAFAAADAQLTELWQRAARDAEARADSEARLDRLLADRTRAILAASYPEAAHLLVEPGSVELDSARAQTSRWA